MRTLRLVAAGGDAPSAATVSGMRCPACAIDDDKVVDSRAAEDGASIRRRRECLSCGGRFTTFERIEEAPLVVRKRSGVTEPYQRDKVVSGIALAGKNRIAAEQLASLATDIEDRVRVLGTEVTTAQIGRAVLDRLREADEVAYLRFASVYKGFNDLDDFRREVGLLLDDDGRPTIA